MSLLLISCFCTDRVVNTNSRGAVKSYKAGLVVLVPAPWMALNASGWKMVNSSGPKIPSDDQLEIRHENAYLSEQSHHIAREDHLSICTDPNVWSSKHAIASRPLGLEAPENS